MANHKVKKIFQKFSKHRIIDWNDFNEQYWYECDDKCFDLENEIGTFVNTIIYNYKLWKSY